MQWDGECRLVVALGAWEISGFDLPLPKEWLPIDRDVVDVHANIFLAQGVVEPPTSYWAIFDDSYGV